MHLTRNNWVLNFRIYSTNSLSLGELPNTLSPLKSLTSAPFCHRNGALVLISNLSFYLHHRDKVIREDPGNVLLHEIRSHGWIIDRPDAFGDRQA